MLAYRIRATAEGYARKFWERASVGSEDDCWRWNAGRQSRGYGTFWANGKKNLAHRFAYEDRVGPIPAGMYLCHRCDNPWCVNPSHMFIGTQADNMHDCAAKNRLGILMRPKLTRDEVVAIRKARESGATAESIGREYGITDSAVLSIEHRKSWAWV